MSGIFDQVINYAPPSLLLGTVTYKGTWSAATNTPTLLNPPSAITNGNYYVVSAAGTQFSLSFNIGDWIIGNGTAWEKVDNTDAVSSVFGRTGAVVGVSTDYSAVGITATAVGASSPSTGAFTTLSSTSTTTLNSTTIPASKTLVVTTDKISVLAATTSAELAGVISDETGSGVLVFGTSPTITTPVIAQINDANGNETLKLASIASAVNEVTIENAATGNAVHISATGGDASVGLHLAGKGASGYVNVQDSVDATKRIMFNASGGTTNTRTMLSSTQTVDRTLSLPDATDTLVGKATTDTLTNKTITGGILNGTLGATTPSSVAATTGTFSSTLGVTGVATLGNGAILGTPASGTVTNLTGTASININGTVGATTPSTVAATTISATGLISSTGDAQFGSASKMLYLRTLSGSNRIDSYDNPITATVPLMINASTYTFQVADVTRATLTSTGLNSCAIGATTASTIAATTVSASGQITASGAFAIRGGAFPATGVGLELVYTSAISAAQIVSFDRDLSAYKGIVYTASSHTFDISGTTRGVVSSTGLAVTGALSASTSLTVAGAGTVDGNIYTKSDGTTYGQFIGSGYIMAAQVGAAVALWNRNGSDGNIVNFYRSGTTVGTISVTTTATAYNTSSDYRLKNVDGPVVDSDTFIDALKPKVGTWKSNGSKFVGFLAHEFAEVSPSSVSGEKDAVDADGKPVYQSMQASNSEVMANIVAELQSLRKRLAALESK
jgi:hypothetical protein